MNATVTVITTSTLLLYNLGQYLHSCVFTCTPRRWCLSTPPSYFLPFCEFCALTVKLWIQKARHHPWKCPLVTDCLYCQMPFQSRRDTGPGVLGMFVHQTNEISPDTAVLPHRPWGIGLGHCCGTLGAASEHSCSPFLVGNQRTVEPREWL